MNSTSDDPSAYFSALGRAVSQNWSRSGRSQAALPRAAELALESVELPVDFDAVKMLGWAAGANALPMQSSARDLFGQPPLVLHREEDFFVQAITWMDGTTAIHEHGFTGAFMVLQGSSLHVEHSFDGAERLADDHLVVGRLFQLEPEVLRPGGIRAIEPGDQFIHALFHLERPTVTVVVRNYSCSLPHPQYSYWSPGLGWDGLWEDRTLARRLQSVDSLLTLDPDAGRRTLHELVTERPLWESFMLVERWCSRHGWNEVSLSLVGQLVARAGSLEGVLAPAFEHEIRVQRILARRGMMNVFHQRLLLALLANLPEPATIARLLGQLYPDRPARDLLIDWVEELSAPMLRGISGLTIPSTRLAELRAAPLGSCELDILTEIRSCWNGTKLDLVPV